MSNRSNNVANLAKASWQNVERREAPAPSRALVEPLEGRRLMSVGVPGTEMAAYASGGTDTSVIGPIVCSSGFAYMKIGD